MPAMVAVTMIANLPTSTDKQLMKRHCGALRALQAECQAQDATAFRCIKHGRLPSICSDPRAAQMRRRYWSRQ